MKPALPAVAGTSGSRRPPRHRDQPIARLDSPTGDLPQCVHTLADGTRILVRAIHKEDAELERAFIRELSPEARWFRFMGTVGEPSDAMLRGFVDLDYTRDVAFVAFALEHGTKREVGVARYGLAPNGHDCECAVAVADAWQKRGLAVILMRHLINVASGRGIRRMVAIEARDNLPMHQLAEFLGFTRTRDPDDPDVVVHRLVL